MDKSLTLETFKRHEMAESFFTSSPSRTFGDFEKEWLDLGKEFEVVFDSGNSPKDLQLTDPRYDEPVKGGKKRKLSESEDSIILTQRKMVKRNFTQQISGEDPLLTTFRQEHPKKYENLEKRVSTRSTFTLESPAPRYIPASPGYIPASPGYTSVSSGYTPVSPGYTPASPGYIPASPGYIPASPGYTSVSSGYTPVSPGYTPASPGYSPASPGYSPACQGSPGYVPVFLPAPDHSLTPRQAPFPAPLESSGCAQVKYDPACENPQHPLKEELRALLELVDSLRVDLLQTSMLLNYVQDYLKKMK